MESGDTRATENFVERTAHSMGDADGSAHFQLDANGLLIAANRCGEELVATGGVKVSAGRLRFGCAASDRALDLALRKARTPDVLRLRVVVRRLDGEWAAGDVYGAAEGGSAVLVLHEVAEVSEEAITAMGSAFGLTPSETQILHAVTVGDCPKEIARRQGISEHTVRSHLRSIYSKLGVRGLTNILRLALRLLA